MDGDEGARLSRQLSDDPELRASLAYALVLQEPEPEPEPQPEPEPEPEPAGPLLAGAAAGVPGVVLHDAADAETAELAPQTFATTVLEQPVLPSDDEGSDGGGISEGVAEPWQTARADVTLRCGEQEFRGLPARTFAAESGWVRRALRASLQTPAEIRREVWELELGIPWLDTSGLAAVTSWVAMQPPDLDDDEAVYGGNMEGLVRASHRPPSCASLTGHCRLSAGGP